MTNVVRTSSGGKDNGNVPSPWYPLIDRYMNLNGKTANHEGWISVNCLLHNDNTQSAGINVHSGRYMCHNPSCQGAYIARMSARRSGSQHKTLGFAELLALTHGWDVLDAQHIVEGYRIDHLDTTFAHDDTVNRNGSAKPDSSTLNYFSVEVEDFVKEANEHLQRDFEDLDIAIDYAYSRGLSADTLIAAGVGFVAPYTKLPDGSTSGVTGCLLFPYWFKSKLIGVRIRQGDSRKRMLRDSHYVPYSINQVFNTTSRTIVVGEGESDTLRLTQALAEMGYENVPVVGTPGSSFNQEWSRFLRRFNRIICVPQADEASQDKFVKSLQRTFRERLEVVQIPWEEDALGGKDVCDYLLMQPHHIKELVELLSVTSHDIEDRPYIKTRAYFENRKDREIDWLIPDVLERGSKCLILGEPKVGKTFIILNLINSALHAAPFMNNPNWVPTATGLRCLLIEEEGSERALGKRILSIINPTDPEDMFGIVHGENIKLDDPTSFDRLRQAVTRFKPDVVVFDPYASLHNQDENSVEGTTVVLDAINTIYRAATGCTIIIVHHTGVDGGRRARGSGSLWGAVDSQLLITKQAQSTIAIEIRGREIEDSDPLFFAFDTTTKTFSPTNPGTVKVVSHKKLDMAVYDTISDLLKDSKKPVTQAEITATIPNAEYLSVRACLLALVDSKLVSRSGSGGRAGYTYVWVGQLP